jgi:hypothetical protein
MLAVGQAQAALASLDRIMVQVATGKLPLTQGSLAAWSTVVPVGPSGVGLEHSSSSLASESLRLGPPGRCLRQMGLPQQVRSMRLHDQHAIKHDYLMFLANQ